MAKLRILERLLAALPTRRTRSTHPQWLYKMHQRRKGKPPVYPDKPDHETYKGDPGSIAQELKNKSPDLKTAIHRLTFYKNTLGDKLNDADKERLDRAKEDLYRAYGEELPPKDRS
jgi:hypothetical protein